MVTAKPLIWKVLLQVHVNLRYALRPVEDPGMSFLTPEARIELSVPHTSTPGCG